jgi:hypothetical protein
MSVEEVSRLITARRTKKTLIKDLVQEICSSPESIYADGFYYKDLPVLKNIILQMYHKIQNGMDDMTDYLIMFIDHCKKRFRRAKASDEVSYRPQLPSFLEAFAEILRPGSLSSTKLPIDENLLKTICSFLYMFASDGTMEARKLAVQNAAEKGPANYSEEGEFAIIKKYGTKNLKAIEDTDIPEILVHLLADFTLNPNMAAWIIQVISSLTVYSNITMKLGDLSILKDLIGIICNCPNFREPLVNMCFENVWNILENCGMGAVETLATEETMLMMREMLEKVIVNGYKLDDRHLRNEICILLCALAACDEAHESFFSTDD